MNRTTSRCDDIIALIDQCLADIERTAPPVPGGTYGAQRSRRRQR